MNLHELFRRRLQTTFSSPRKLKIRTSTIMINAYYYTTRV
jgi:hypothetical protein